VLSSQGVGFRSATEAYLDSCGMFKEAIISTLAKQERLCIPSGSGLAWIA